MSKTIKIGLTCVLLLAVLIFGILPGVIGLLAQKHLSSVKHKLAAAGSPAIISDYKRHWFSSDAVIILPSLPPYHITIHHGPIIFNNGITLALATINSSSAIGPYQGTIKTILAYDKSIYLQ